MTKQQNLQVNQNQLSMTPRFITPCIVRIDDADKQAEVCQRLENRGYTNYGNPFQRTDFSVIFTTTDGYYVPYNVTNRDGSWTDCGTNTELFLALASMRSDTDKGQWFTDGKEYQFCKLEKWMDYWRPEYHHIYSNWRKATAAEITEHFNKK